MIHQRNGMEWETPFSCWVWVLPFPTPWVSSLPHKTSRTMTQILLSQPQVGSGFKSSIELPELHASNHTFSGTCFLMLHSPFTNTTSSHVQAVQAKLGKNLLRHSSSQKSPDLRSHQNMSQCWPRLRSHVRSQKNLHVWRLKDVKTPCIIFHVERVPRVTNLNPHFADAKIIMNWLVQKTNFCWFNDQFWISFCQLNFQKSRKIWWISRNLELEFPEMYWVSPLQELWAIPQRCHRLKQGSSLAST